MKVEYLNPFIKATNDVFNMMLGVSVEKKDLKLNEELKCSNDANVILGIIGDLQGNILFSFPKKMVLEMVKNMSGLEVKEINKFVSSALGEVANIISGNAMTILSQTGYSCDIVPPKVIIDEQNSINIEDGQPLLIKLDTELGEFELNLYLEEKSME